MGITLWRFFELKTNLPYNMKRASYCIIAMLTIILASSCHKSKVTAHDDEFIPQTRLVSLFLQDFDGGTVNTGITKSVIDGMSPRWVEGDQIWLSNGTDSEIVTLTSDNIYNNVATVSTNLLSGTLYAVFPASAQNGISDKRIGFTIPSKQDGTFGQAMISVAQGGDSLNLQNVITQLRLSSNFELDSIKVTTASVDICGDFNFDISSDEYETGSFQTDSIVVVPTQTGGQYIEIIPGIGINELTFTVFKKNGGIVQRTFSEATNLIGKNKIYNLGDIEDWQ